MKASNLAARRAATIIKDNRWQQVLTRDRSADGQFFYSVRTTGVYCRPSCPSRTARPENVVFHPTREAARRAGFRPCKRCKPDQSTSNAHHAEKITAACRIIERADGIPSLQALAEQVGMSAFHFHRIFTATTGLTPRKYAMAHRARRVRRLLDQSGSVTEAILEAGYASHSRFYDSANEILGMTPTMYRAGGTSNDIRFAVGECSLGSILVAMSNRGVCAILMGNDPDALVRDLQDRFPKANLVGGDRQFEQLVAQVVGLAEKPADGLDLPLDVRGTAFQQRVWQALRKIPPGATATYAQIASWLGAPKAVRAVAQACAANPIAIAIPCHRVVRSDGGLSGYRWGVERKQALLEREAASTRR